MNSIAAYESLQQRLGQRAATRSLEAAAPTPEPDSLQRLNGFVYLPPAQPERSQAMRFERDSALREQRPALLIYDTSKRTAVLWADFDFASESDLPLQLSLDGLLETGLTIIQSQQKLRDKGKQKHGLQSMHLGQRKLILRGPRKVIRSLTKPINDIWLNPLTWEPADGRDWLLGLIFFRDWPDLGKAKSWLETSIREAQDELGMCPPCPDCGVPLNPLTSGRYSECSATGNKHPYTPWPYQVCESCGVPLDSQSSQSFCEIWKKPHTLSTNSARPLPVGFVWCHCGAIHNLSRKSVWWVKHSRKQIELAHPHRDQFMTPVRQLTRTVWGL